MNQRRLFNAQLLTAGMIDAAREAVAERWPALRALAEVALRRLAESLNDVAALLEDGAIDAGRARQLVHIQQISARAILATVLGLSTAEQVTQAAVRVASEPVNRVVGFPLLPAGDTGSSFKAGKDL
jgi:hypothetical protein